MVDRSSRARMYVAALVVASLLLPVHSGRADSSLPTVYVNYTMSCTFTMTDDAGKALTSVAPGSYQILVTSPVPFAAVDLAGINDMTACRGSAQFALSGPGRERHDDDGRRRRRQRVPLRHLRAELDLHRGRQHPAGRRPFLVHDDGGRASRAAERRDNGGDDDHAGEGSDRLGREQRLVRRRRCRWRASPTGARSPRRSPTRVRLPSPTRARAVTALRAGRYTIAVTDQSRRTGFVVQKMHGATTWLSTGGLHRYPAQVDRFHEGAVELLPLDGRGEDLLHRPLVSAATAAGWLAALAERNDRPGAGGSPAKVEQRPPASSTISATAA